MVEISKMETQLRLVGSVNEVNKQLHLIKFFSQNSLFNENTILVSLDDQLNLPQNLSYQIKDLNFI